MHLLNKLPEHLINATPMSMEEWKSVEGEALLAKNALRAQVKGVKVNILPDLDYSISAPMMDDPFYQAIMKAHACAGDEEYLFEGLEGDLYVEAQGMTWWCEAQQMGFQVAHGNLGMFAIGDTNDMKDSDEESENEEEKEHEEGDQHFFMVIDVPTLTMISGEQVKPEPIDLNDDEEEEEEEEEEKKTEEHAHEHEHEGGCCDESIPPFWTIRLWGNGEDALEQLYDAVADCARLHPNGENMEEMEDFDLVDGEEIDSAEDDDEEGDSAEEEGDSAEDDEEGGACGNCECHDDDDEPAAKEARLE